MKIIELAKIEKYKQLKLKWNLSSMLFINNSGFILEDLNSENYVEALILVMTSGLESRNSETIKRFINKYYSAYKEIDSIRDFVIYDLLHNHNFITEKVVDDEPIHPLLKNKMKGEEKSHSEKLKLNKENYEYIIRVYLQAGYRIDEILQMDLKNFDFINDFVVRQHEEKLNDFMLLAHRVGLMSGIGFSNLNKYPDKPETIRLRPKTKEEIIAEKEAEAKAFQASIQDDIK